MSLEERIKAADTLIAFILRAFGLEFRGEYDTEIWLEPVEKEEKKPDLRIVN